MKRTVIAAVGACVLLVAACSSGSSPSTGNSSSGTGNSSSGSSAPGPVGISQSPSASESGTPQQGGTATFALTAGSAPNYIFPLDTPTLYSAVNMEQFQKLMYRPLYMYGVNGQPVVNPKVSLAYPPTFDDAKHTVTVKLRNYTWSNGEPVSASDVVFWQNLVTAEKNNWGGYAPGLYPDNIVSTHVDGPEQVTFTLNGAYNHTWFWYNELTYITPLPAAWDKTSDSGAAGSGGCATEISKCKAVYKYLAGKAKNLNSYASDPLWQVVDGPWQLKSFSSDGHITFVPNPKFSGPDKAHLSEFKMVPFTSTEAEVSALRAGSSISVGYLPATSLPTGGGANVPNPVGDKYKLVPWYLWGIDYLQPNYNNPKVGPMLRQLYIRQALQHLVDQQSVIKGAFKGYGYPTNGPIPIQPSNPYASSYEKSNPYPFSISDATQLLKSHGWAVHPNGHTTCAHAGTAANQCGAGIAQGTQLSFNLMWGDYGPAYGQSMNLLRSNASRAGITIKLDKVPVNTSIGDTVRCKSSQSTCNWQLIEYGGWDMRPYPVIGQLFSTATSDGSWFETKTNTLIQNAVHANSATGLQDYENFLAKQLPLIWQPMQVEQISEIATNLHGVTPQNPMLTLTPENWYFVKS